MNNLKSFLLLIVVIISFTSIPNIRISSDFIPLNKNTHEEYYDLDFVSRFLTKFEALSKVSYEVEPPEAPKLSNYVTVFDNDLNPLNQIKGFFQWIGDYIKFFGDCLVWYINKVRYSVGFVSFITEALGIL